MKLLMIVCAVVLHAGFLLFGGILFVHAEEDQSTHAEVDLLSTEAVEEEERPDPEETEEMEAETEEVPDAAEIIRNLETPAAIDAPELDAVSLGAIEAALAGNGGAGGDFAEALGFASGGRIGGTGKAGALDESLERAFSLDEIDQKPRATFQAAPSYPAEMRSRKVEGVVVVKFVVDAAGKVTDARVESTSHTAFDRPALEAVRRWKFEPAVRGGQRVACKMRVPIRFQPSE